MLLYKLTENTALIMSFPHWKFVVDFGLFTLAFEALDSVTSTLFSRISFHDPLLYGQHSSPVGLGIVPGTSRPIGLCLWLSFFLAWYSHHFRISYPLGVPALMNPLLCSLIRHHLSSSPSGEHQQNTKCHTLCSWWATALFSTWLGTDRYFC